MDYYIEYTHFLCRDFQKYVAHKDLTLFVMEEYNHFTVLSNKGRAKVKPTKAGIIIQFFQHKHSTPVSTITLPLNDDITTILKEFLL